MRLLVIALLLLKSPWFQNWITDEVASTLSEDLQTEVSVGRVDLQLFKTMVIDEIFIADLQGDTLAFIPSLQANVKSFSLQERDLALNHVTLVEPRIKLQKYPAKEHLNFQFLIDHFSSDEPKDTTAKPWDIAVDEVGIEQGHLSLYDHADTSTAYGVNFKNMDLKGLELVVDDFGMEEDTIFSHIANLAFREQSGFVLDTLCGALTVNPSEIALQSTVIRTPETNIVGDLAFQTASYASYSDFLNEVRHRIDLNNTEVQLADLAYFVPALEGIDRKIEIRAGKVRGFISALKGKEFDLVLDRNTSFQGNFDLLGLPNIEETFISFNIKNLNTHHRDLERIPLPPFTANNTLDLPPQIKDLGHVKLKGRFEGFVNDFVAKGTFFTEMGDVETNLALRRDSLEELHYKGTVSTAGLNIGRLTQNDLLGVISSDLEVNGRGVAIDDVHASLLGQVHEMDLKGYRYQNIDINGDIEGKEFIGELNIDDQNLALEFDGDINFNGRKPKMKFEADVQHAYLAKLNLVDRDTTMVLNTHIVMDFEGAELDDMSGTVLAEKTYLVEKGQLYDYHNIKITSLRDSAYKSFVLTSDFLHVDLRGEYTFKELPNSALAIASSIVPALFGTEVYIQNKPEIMDYTIVFQDFSPVTRFLMPELQIAPYTTLNGSYNGYELDVQMDADGEYIIYDQYKFDEISMEVGNIADLVYLKLRSGDIHLSDTSDIQNVELTTFAYQDVVPVSVTWNNIDSLTFGKLKGDLYLDGLDKFEFDFRESEIAYKELDWMIDPKSRVLIDSTSITVDRFEAHYLDQLISLNGKVSEDSTERLSLKFDNFDLVNVNPFLEGSGVQLYGLVNGDGFVADAYRSIIFESDALVELFGINDEMVGDVRVNATYADAEKRVLLDGFVLRGEDRTVDFSGFYYPSREENSIDILSSFSEADIAVINAFMPEETATLSGVLLGEMHIGGVPDSLLMEGTLDFRNASAYIDMTNVRYRFEGEVKVQPDYITMDYIPFTDGRGGTGLVTGALAHQNFGNMDFDMSIDLERLMCLNTNAAKSDLYYGTAFGTGNVSMYGYQDSLNIRVDFTPDKGTLFNLPLSGSTEVTQSDFVNFDPYKQEAEQEEKVDLTGIDMIFNIHANEDARMRVIFDEAVGDIMEGTGNGDLTMQITPKGDLKLNGTYTVSEGEYLFTLQNIINKRFKVKPGGQVKWYGDPYKGVLDLQAYYEVRTTLYDLLQEEDPAYKRRIPVNVLMSIENQMLNPDIHFGLELPGADQNTVSIVNSVVSTEQDLNKQVFALLLLNKFLPAREGNVAGNGAGGAASASSSEVLSNQLTTWMNKLSNRLDLGINYRPGDHEITGDELAVAVSTALFNDRITVSTNVGVSGAGSDDNSSSGLIGDFALEYKITEDGRLRIRAYNESNAGDLTGDQARYVQGVGVYYREEFDSAANVYFLQALLNPFRGKDNEKKKAFQAKKAARKEKKRQRKEEEQRRKKQLKARHQEIMEEAERKKQAKDAIPAGGS